MDTKPSLANTISLFASVLTLTVYALLLVGFIPFKITSNLTGCFFIGITLFMIVVFSTFLKTFVNGSQVHGLNTGWLAFFSVFLPLPVLYLGCNTEGSLPGILPNVLFWCTVLVWTIGWSLRTEKNDSNNNLLAITSYFWVFLCVFMTIGTSEIALGDSYLGFASKAIEDIPIFIKFADLRVLIGMLVGIFICCKALGKAFQNPKNLADIPKIPKILVPDVADGFFKILIKVPILALNIVLTILVFILNTVWSVISVVIYYAAWFVVYLGKEIYGQYIRIEYVRLLLAIGLIVTLILIPTKVQDLNADMLNYFEDGGLAPFLKTASILLALFIFIMTASTIIIHEAAIDNYLSSAKIWGEDITYKVTYLFSAMWFAGLLLYGIAQTPSFDIYQFSQLGQFTMWATVLIVGSGVVSTIISGVKKARAGTKP